MKSFLTNLLKAALLTVSLAHLASASEISTRIVGGNESGNGDWPWAVSLKSSASQTHFCGASLIAQQWVLTAAHCLYNSENLKLTSQLTATVGEYDLNSTPITPAISIEQIYVHPDYNSSTIVNDIALLKLASSVNNPSLISPVDIAVTESAIAAVENVTALGWGSTRAYSPDGQFSPDYPDILHDVEIPLMTDTMCTNALGSNYTAEMICAGLPEGGKDSCVGDSGGPLMIQDNGWKQIGIVSWGNGCAAPGYPGVYTRLALYKEWVDSIIKGIYFPANLEFNDTIIGERRSKTIVIENNSNNNASLTFAEKGDNSFSFDYSKCTFIVANNSCNLMITYRPSDTKISHKRITIISNLPASVPQQLSLLGLPLIDATEIATAAVFQLENIAWFTGGYVPWQFNQENSYLQSGNIADNQKSLLHARVTGSGKLSFDWSVQSESRFDKLLLIINGEIYSSISGAVDFDTQHIYLDKMLNEVVWRYEKNATVSNLDDRAYVANVTFDQMTKDEFDLWVEQNKITTNHSGGGAMGWLSFLLLPALFSRRFYKFR